MSTHHEPAFAQPLVEREGVLVPVNNFGCGGMTRLELVATLLLASTNAHPEVHDLVDSHRAWALKQAREWLDYLDAHQNDAPQGAKENGDG